MSCPPAFLMPQKNGEEVNLPGFGKFKVKDSQARQGRNPGTGETIEIAGSRKPGFRLAKQMRDALAGWSLQVGQRQRVGDLTEGHAPPRQETGAEADGAHHASTTNQEVSRIDS